MSESHDHDDDDAVDAHEHGFDGEPAKELSPGEAPTPGWLSAVGAALFVAAAVFFFATRDKAPAPPAEAAPAASAPQIVATAMQPKGALPARPGAGAGTGTAPANVRKLSPEQIKDVQRRIEEARQKSGGANAPAPGPSGAK